MNMILVAINAKYVHSNLAVYCLKSYAASKGFEAGIAEYTINQQPGEVLRDLYEKHADVVAFSCYIWNIEYVKALLCDYKKICPKTELWLGGPEVSYRAKELLHELPQVRGVMCGEGEETFAKLAAHYHCGKEQEKLSEIPGIVFCTDRGEIQTTVPAAPLDFSSLPFPYEGVAPETFSNRILYYESGRGCPYSCAYCLSSIEKKVRYRDLELVKKELKLFLDRRVPQVKFIDRTFNANAERTTEILRFLKENDNGTTNFHFEIAAELLNEEQTALLCSLRPGLVQLEIGVQSANEETLAAVHRKTDTEKLKQTIAKVREKGNVHIHLDLIAGLPKEDIRSFRNSFNEVYRMRPHQLQLGFLKVLSGAPMERMAAENGILYQGRPPYEVLRTECLSFDDITELKKTEEMTEVYYNSGQFVHSMRYLEHFFATPYEMYAKLARYYEETGLFGRKLSRVKRYEILLEFCAALLQETGTLEQILFFDFCLREKVKGRPEFGRHSHMEKQEIQQSYASFGIGRASEGRYDAELFSFHPEKTALCGARTGKPCVVLFSYENREPIYGQATIQVQERE